MLTFDENDTYEIGNKIFTFLLGGAVPKHLIGTQDPTFYTHYSIIASLSANFGLPSLGRWDCAANLLSFLAKKVGYVNYEVNTNNLYLNQSYDGPMAAGDYSQKNSIWPFPVTEGECSGGHGILDVVKKTWGGLEARSGYAGSPVPFDKGTGIGTGINYQRTLVSFFPLLKALGSGCMLMIISRKTERSRSMLRGSPMGLARTTNFAPRVLTTSYVVHGLDIMEDG